VSNGVAKHAQIAFTDLGGASGSFLTPARLGDDYFKYAYEAGARIHSDSWGLTDFTYNSQAREVDNFLYEHEYFTALFSVGNSGTDASSESAVSPSTAKNTVAVGATKSVYSPLSGYIDQRTWDIKITGKDSSHWQHYLIRGVSANFASNRPVATTDIYLYSDYACEADVINANVTGKIVLVRRGICSFVQKAINVQNQGASALLVLNNKKCRFVLMAGTTTQVKIPVIAIPQKEADLLVALLLANLSKSLEIAGPVEYPSEKWEYMKDWSSGGPTPEGRIKPDVVAPGGYIKSAARVTNEQFSAGQTCQETSMSCTSMACPLTAGSVALIRQYLTDGFYPEGIQNSLNAFQPTGALHPTRPSASDSVPPARRHPPCLDHPQPPPSCVEVTHCMRVSPSTFDEFFYCWQCIP
jgi:hypothetical protein